MAIPATQIRRGTVVLMDGDPCRVIEFRHHTPGNLRALVQTKLRNLRTGVMFEHRFRAADQVEVASLETHELQYLYSDGLHYHFMNQATYEMLELDDEALGDAAQWLTPNLVIQAEFYDGRPIGIQLPNVLELTVAETEPGVRGDTKTSVMKPAKLENGVVVQVPAFIDVGEAIRVDPREGKYLGRVS